MAEFEDALTDAERRVAEVKECRARSAGLLEYMVAQKLDTAAAEAGLRMAAQALDVLRLDRELGRGET